MKQVRDDLSREDVKRLRGLETSLHRRDIRGSPDKLYELLSDDFIEFGSSGRVFRKSEIIKSLAKENADLGITVEEFSARKLATGLALVTYRAIQSDGVSLRSSIWRLGANQKWQMVFHQGTKVRSQT